MGCHFLLQEIFLTQGTNLCLLRLLHWQADFSPLYHLGSPISHHKYSENTWILYIKQTRSFLKVRRKHRGLRPNTSYSSNFHRLSFCLVYPRLSAKELSNLETPVGAIKISTKSLLSSKRTKKGPDQQEKKLYNNIIRLQSNSTDKMWCTFTLVTKGWVGSPDFHPHLIATRHSQNSVR